LSRAHQHRYNFIRSVKSAASRQYIYNSIAIHNALQADDRIKGIAPKITAQVFFHDGPIDITGVVDGIDIEKEQELFHFSDYIIAGEPENLNTVSNSIILGKALADKLQLSTGDVVRVTTASGTHFVMKLVGIFQSGLQDIDKIQSYTSLATARKILNKPNDYITDLQLQIKNIDDAAILSKEFSERFATKADDIKTSNAQFETGSFIRSLISYSVGITLLIVAGFGIYNILNMMIYEKMDTIAILKAIGFSGSNIKRIFLIIGLSIGLFGGSLGLLFGYLFSSVIDLIPFRTASLPTITTYPVSYNPVFYVIAITFSLVTTYLAGWAPSRKASKIDPVLIIRGK
jgi:lipoprotein-releasing system permease protein